MKCHILRWNPNISSYTEQIHLNNINAILKGELKDFNWSVYNWQEVKGGDFWILQKVGTDEDGIAGFGQFAGLPYESNSWRKDGTKLYFSKLNVWCLIDRTVSKTLSAKELEKEFPEINWHGGHSGEMVSEEMSEKLFLKLFTHFMGNLGPNPVEAFDSSCEEDIQDNFIDFLKRMAPKFCREFYEKHDCVCTNCNKICNPKPKYKDVSFYYKCGGDSLSKYPENPTLKDLENYLELNAFCEEFDAEHEE